MSVEILLSIIAFLLFLILVMQIVIFKTNLNAVDLVQVFTDQIDDRRKATHKDLSDLMEEGKFDKVVEISHKRLESEPLNATLLWYMGTAQFRIKEWSSAKETLEKAIEVEPRFKKDLEEYFEVIKQHV